VKAEKRIPTVVFVQPVLAPYAVPRCQALASAGDMDLHVVLEAASFVERPNWIPREIENCRVHVAKSLLKRKEVHNRELHYKETFTKAIPYGIVPVLFNVSPDMVIFCNPTQVLCALPFLLTRRCSVGLILEDTPVSQAHKFFLITFLRRVLYQRLDYVFCFSEEAKEYARSLELKARLYRSSWSIDPAWLEQAPRAKRSRNAVTFLFVGQLNPRKGIMPLLLAWKEFSGSDSDKKKLVVVGEGPLLQAAECFCQENELGNVQFTGGIPYHEVKEFYVASDVFVLPTMEDLFSLVITEAMAFALPVMTTIYNGAKELIIDQENGWVFDSKDISSVVQALEGAWEKRDELASMGRKSHEVISHYTHGAVMERMRMDLHKEFALLTNRTYS
jgi:glycosyltransferase involved in cell wall biosynthesis